MSWLAWTEIVVVIVLGTYGQIALKLGLAAGAGQRPAALLRSVWIWSWFASYVVCTAMWLFALRSVPLSQAFPLLGAQFALIPVASARFLRESVSPAQWLGVAVIAIGTALVGQS